jgi:hypothetical protein
LYAKLDVNAPAVGHSARLAGREVFVGVSNPLVELLLEFVFDSVGIGIAAVPEVFDKLLALLVCVEFLPGVAFGLREDQVVVVDPLLEGLVRLRLDLARLFLRVLFLLLSGNCQ